METDCVLLLSTGEQIPLTVTGDREPGDTVFVTIPMVVLEVTGRRTSLDSLKPIDRAALREWMRCEDARRAVA